MVKQLKMFFVTMMLFYFEFTLIFQSVVKLCFYERKLQVQESEKYEEWKSNRPADRILEIGKTYSQLIKCNPRGSHHTNTETLHFLPP